MDAMHHFDITLLQALIAVADAGSLTAAAPRLCRSQSAVSEQIRKLEEDCGARLFHRSKKGVSPTPAGQRLLGHARQLVAQHERVYQEMRGIQLAGDLRLAITDYFRPTVIAHLLRQIRMRYPHLRLHVSIRKSEIIESGHVDTDFDIGLSMRILDSHAAPMPQTSKAKRLHVLREPLAWIAEPSWVHEGGKPLPLVVLPETCALQQFIVRTLHANRMPYFIAHSASGVLGLQLALAAGLGISCLNASAIPAGMRRMVPSADCPLPDLPDVEFSLRVPQEKADALVEGTLSVLRAAFAGDASSTTAQTSPNWT